MILDPGTGLASAARRTGRALRALERVVALWGLRVLVGTSRKRFLAELLTDASAAAWGRRDASVAAGLGRRDAPSPLCRHRPA
ncbi:MAG: dihydropteroate synthase [Microbacterium sp.]